MASALWLGSMEPQRLAPFLSLPVQVMVTPVKMAPVLPGQRFFTPGDKGETIAAVKAELQQAFYQPPDDMFLHICVDLSVHFRTRADISGIMG